MASMISIHNSTKSNVICECISYALHLFSDQAYNYLLFLTEDSYLLLRYLPHDAICVLLL